MLLFLKFAAKMVKGSSATVRMTTFGLVTNVPPMGNVIVIQATTAHALEPFSQIGSTVRHHSKLGLPQ